MPEVSIFADAEALSRAAADLFAEKARAAIRSGGRFCVSLAGGSTPKRAYARLASDEHATRIDWGQVHVFWGDERLVPPDHPDSNFRMAREAFLTAVPIPAENIHRMRTEFTAKKAAEDYSSVIRTVFALSGDELPRFDLVLLGMGLDGHTASIFPGDDLTAHTGRLVAATPGERMGHRRLTLTLPAINNAACVVFLVTGMDKAKTLSKVLKAGMQGGRTSHQAPRLPAQLVAPARGELLWFVDEAAGDISPRFHPS
jgi:6-phosphogluconolactonase